MPLLSEYALTHDVFDTASYSSEELADSRLDLLKEALFNEGIVRDLREGEWRAVFSDKNRSWHRWGKELMKKLATQGRLLQCSNKLATPPTNDADWCNEALASHCQNILEGIITTDAIAAQHGGNPVVTSISKLARAPWWGQRGGTLPIDRKIEAYLQNLSLLFSCSNHLMFIDQYLSPESHNYRDFKDLIRAAMQKTPMPRVEIHRTITEGSGRNIRLVPQHEWEDIFRNELLPVLPDGAQVEVFLWDEMHDRYLISNVVGVSLLWGFDTSKKKNDLTKWLRLDRNGRDDVMREFDPASNRHTLRGRFRV